MIRTLVEMLGGLMIPFLCSHHRGGYRCPVASLVKAGWQQIDMPGILRQMNDLSI